MWMKEEPTAQPSPTQKSSEATAISSHNRSTLGNQQDWPHEFYVKKSGSVDVKKGLLSERSEFQTL